MRYRRDVETLMDWDALIVPMYEERGLLRNGAPVHLPTECPRAEECWRGERAARHPARNTPAAALSAPYIGHRYNVGGLAIVLENLRNYGGWDITPQPRVGMRFLANAARAGIAKGHKVLFRGGGYRGTNVWYRAVAYAAEWLGCDGINGSSTSGTMSPTTVAEALDFIALLQHVKCSPMGGRSDQNANMWQNCGPHVLAHELQVLRPGQLIVLGQGDNATAMRSLLPRLVTTFVTETVKLGRRTTRIVLERRLGPTGDVDVLFVPHPAALGGTSNKLMDAVRHSLVATRAARMPRVV